MLVTVSLLLAAACLVPAAGKLLGHPKMRRSAAHFGIAWRHYQFIGMAELAAAAGMTLLLLGALAAHGRARDRAGELLPVLATLAITTAYLAVAL
jgi:DoxX-like family